MLPLPRKPQTRLAAAAWLLLLMGLLWPAARGDEAQGVLEADLKAAVLLKFADFITWPTPPGGTLRVGVFDDPELLASLSRLSSAVEDPDSEGGAVQTMRIRVLVFNVTSPEDVTGAHILVIGDKADVRVAEILRKANRSGVLTVGNWNEARPGAVVRIFRENRRVRFEINQSLAQQAGLKISSRLLNLARRPTSALGPIGLPGPTRAGVA